MQEIKNEQVTLGSTAVLSDIKSFFTSVPLTETISITLDHDYNRKKYQLPYQIIKQKKSLTLCTFHTK